MSYHTIHYLTIHCCQNSKCDKITLLIRTLTSATWRKVCTAFHRHDIAQENAEISEVAQWNFTALHCSCFWNTEFAWCIHTAGRLMFLTMCQYLPTLGNPCAVNVSHYKINPSSNTYDKISIWQELISHYHSILSHTVTKHCSLARSVSWFWIPMEEKKRSMCCFQEGVTASVHSHFYAVIT